MAAPLQIPFYLKLIPCCVFVDIGHLIIDWQSENFLQRRMQIKVNKITFAQAQLILN